MMVLKGQLPQHRIQSEASARANPMSSPEPEVDLEDTDRLEGRAALVNNVNAALALAGAVRSTLGPRGSDKMLVGEGGEVVVTNDGVTVLETAKVEHPTANLLISTSSAQDRLARDGTTTTVLLTAELLRNALELTRIGVHPSVIMNGYRIALDEALSQLAEISREAADKSESRAVIATALAGKIDTKLASVLTDLALDAAAALAQEEGGGDLERLRVKRLQVASGKASDSEVVHGLVIRKQRLDFTTPSASDGGVIALVDGGLENRELMLDAEIEVRSLGVLAGFHQRTREKLQTQVDHLASLGVELLCVRDGIADEAHVMLTAAGITVYRRFEREDLERLACLTGAAMVRDVGRMSASDVGEYSSRSEEKIENSWHLRIDGNRGAAMTALLRGTTPTMREEVSRAFDDALGVAHRLSAESSFLPGGGATQIHLARHLRAYAPSQKGREQLAIEGFADALEIIPRALAENAGLDPIDEILELSSAQSKNGPWIGLDVMSGDKTDMASAGITDPLFVARQALTGATEAAITVLRIDDVLWAQVEPGTPDWNSEESEEEI